MASPSQPYLNSPRPNADKPPVCEAHGTPAALLQTRKDSANKGRWFWRCAHVTEQCDFFEWSGGPPSPHRQKPAGGASGSAPTPRSGGGGASSRIHLTMLADATRFAVEAPYDEELLEVLRSPEMRAHGGAWDGEAKQWSYDNEAYEPLLQQLRVFCEGRSGWEVCPVPKFVRELLGSRYAQRTPRAAAAALFASLPATRGEQHCLATDLKEHQKEGVIQLLMRSGRGLLADEMGLGKSAQAIAVAAAYHADWPLLVMCPSSLRDTWKRELAAWLPPGFAHVHVVTKGKDEPPGPGGLTRGSRLAVVVSYDLVAAVSGTVFGVVIADECHLLKSRDTVRAKAALPKLSDAARSLCLTGTPLLSRPAEAYTLLKALMPDAMPSWAQYGLRYCAPRPALFPAGGTDYSGASCVAELHLLLSRTLLVRRTKAEAGASLPAKARQVVALQLGERDAAAARAAGDKASAVRERAGAGTPAAQAALTEYYTVSAKAKQDAVCDHALALLRAEPAAKVLFFAHHKSVLDALEAALRRAAVPLVRIDGETPPRLRTAAVDAFQAPASALRCAVLSLGAASVGLTLTAATRVVFAELSWTPGVMLQAEDRAHRVGQAADVAVTYLLAKGTIDDLMWPVIMAKLKVTGRSVDGRAGGMRTGADVADGGGADGAGGALFVSPPAVQLDDEEDEDAPLRRPSAGGGMAASPTPRRQLAPSLAACADADADVIDLCRDSDEDAPLAPPAAKRQRASGGAGTAAAAASPFSSPPSKQQQQPRRQSGLPGDPIEID